MVPAWFIPILAVLSGLYAVWQTIPLNTLVWPSLAVGVFLFLAALRAERDSPLRNISGLLLVAALSTSLAAYLAQNGFSLIAVELTLLISALALLVGWILRSKPSVLLSAFSSLIYMASFYPKLGLTTGLGDQLSQLGSGLVPWLILGQIFLAQKLRSSIVLIAAILAFCIWLGTQMGDIPMEARAGLGFAIAAAHYWLGKIWAESGTFGSHIHRFFAWVLGISAALYFQSIWLGWENGPSGQAFWPPSTLWWSVFGAAILTLFVAALIRYKSSYISLLGVFIICLAVVSVSLATVNPSLIHTVFDTVPGLFANPGLGFIMGAIIIAVGLILTIAGLRSGELTSMLLGVSTIGIEILVLIKASEFNEELSVVFIVSLIAALSIGSLIAGALPDDKGPHRNFA